MPAERNPMPSRRREAGVEPVLMMLLLFVVLLTLYLILAGRWGRRDGRNRMANESSAIASLKNLVTAEECYKCDAWCYGTLAEIAVHDALLARSSPKYQPFLDAQLKYGMKNGYRFVVTVGSPPDSKWRATASPAIPGTSGRRFFFVDDTGVIRFRAGAPATWADSPIE